jgi:lipoprotein-anchoring transpeptidase ErfK/SrfK
MHCVGKIISALVILLGLAFAANAAQLVARNWAVSTGKAGHYTPRGAYRPQRMATMWRSRKYDNAPMPYSVFFTGGYAVHGTNHVKALGRPASHGCVRLQTKNAARFYALIERAGRKNTRIVITN